MTSSVIGADTTAAQVSLDSANTTVLIAPATTPEIVAPHRNAWTLASTGSGSTRSSHQRTGPTMNSGMNANTTLSGESRARSAVNGTAITAPAITGHESHPLSRGLFLRFAETCPVQAQPSHHRHGLDPQGSEYQPAGLCVVWGGRGRSRTGGGPPGSCPGGRGCTPSR